MKRSDINSVYKLVGNNIRTIREGNDYSQIELADLLGITRSSIINIEKGRQRCTIDKVIEIAIIFKSNYSDILPDKLNLKKELERITLLRLKEDKARVEIRKLQSQIKKLKSK